MRRVTLRAATQPPLGGELPPTASTAQTMLMVFRIGRRVPLVTFWCPSSFYAELVVSMVTLKLRIPLLTFAR